MRRSSPRPRCSRCTSSARSTCSSVAPCTGDADAADDRPHHADRRARADRDREPAGRRHRLDVTVRVGVDVGGTFTKAVAFDLDDGRGRRPRGRCPTTHEHDDGVAAGVLDAVARVVARSGADRDRAGHALHDAGGQRAARGRRRHRRRDRARPPARPAQGRKRTRLDRVELAPGKPLRDRARVPRRHRRARPPTRRAAAIDRLRGRGRRRDLRRRGVLARRRQPTRPRSPSWPPTPGCPVCASSELTRAVRPRAARGDRGAQRVDPADRAPHRRRRRARRRRRRDRRAR